MAATNKKIVKKSLSVQTAGLRRGGPGRPRGCRNKVTSEAKAAATLIVDDPIYREGLMRRARQGKLAPAIETLLWHYSKGRPKDAVEQPTELRVVWDDGE